MGTMNQLSDRNSNTVAWEAARALVESSCAPIDAWLGKHQQVLVDMRRHLHMYPEPSGQEQATTVYLAERLSEVGVSAVVLRDGLGLVADAVIGDPGPESLRVALRADIDALKIQDSKSLDYRSCHDGVMHACGHDAHASIVMGVAMAVAEATGEVQFEPGMGMHLRYLFQPAEEICLGARWLIDQGVLDGVDAILGLHVDPESDAGRIGVRYGPLTAVCHEVEIRIRGEGGHAARPHQSRDPLAAAISLASNLYTQLPRTVDSRHPSVFSIGRFSGGTLPNVIPDEVEILGSLRTVVEGDDSLLKEAICRIAAGVSSVTGTEIEVSFRASLEAVRNDSWVTRAIEEAALAVVGDGMEEGGEGCGAVWRIEEPSMGGEDFSGYQQLVPGSMFRLGTRQPGQASHLLHTPGFDVDEAAMVPGARVMIRAALLCGFAQPAGPKIGSKGAAGRDNGREASESRLETGSGG